MEINNIWNISYGFSSNEYTNILNAFDSDSSIKKHTGSAFHYTSFENCLKMLEPVQDDQNEYFELFASHFNYMNDTREFLEGLDIILSCLKDKNFETIPIQKTIDEFRSIYTGSIYNQCIPPYYIVSFTDDFNNLAQWKYYGKHCGVAIEYDLENSFFSGFRADEMYENINSYSVNYNKNNQVMEINRILSELNNLKMETNKEIHVRNVLLKSCASAMFMKSQYYKDENEIRLLFAPYYNDEVLQSWEENMKKLIGMVNYRIRGDKYIIPYLKIKIKSSKDKEYPIKSLTVGPGQNQDLIYKSLMMFVASKLNKYIINYKEHKTERDCECIEVNGVKVRRSLIPFRG